LKKILLSVQNNLLSEAIQNALVKKGRFCIENVSPNQDGKILDLSQDLPIQLLRNGLSFVEK